MFVYMFGVTNRRLDLRPEAKRLTSRCHVERRAGGLWCGTVRCHLVPTAGRSDPRDSQLGRFLRRTRPPPTVPARAVDEQIFRLILIAGVRDHHAGRHLSSRLEHDQRVGGP